MWREWNVGWEEKNEKDLGLARKDQRVKDFKVRAILQV